MAIELKYKDRRLVKESKIESKMVECIDQVLMKK